MAKEVIHIEGGISAEAKEMEEAMIQKKEKKSVWRAHSWQELNYLLSRILEDLNPSAFTLVEIQEEYNSDTEKEHVMSVKEGDQHFVLGTIYGFGDIELLVKEGLIGRNEDDEDTYHLTENGIAVAERVSKRDNDPKLSGQLQERNEDRKDYLSKHGLPWQDD